MYIPHRHLLKIEQKADELLQACGINSPPVPVNEIVSHLGLQVDGDNLGEGISGILVIENGKGTIGYNRKDNVKRQRFTIAHEAGHFVFHRQLESEVFIDRDFIVKYRSEKDYTDLEARQEQEANIFAAALLMPRDMLKREFEKEEYANLKEVAFIEKMAQVFDVSSQAMTYRIANTNLM
jgi:Zn-dependent peptidase ImmA (M78 family)